MTLGFDGPGLPPAETDLALVPRHPETGELWRPSGPAVAIPLAHFAWRRLALPVDHRLLGAAGTIPSEVTGPDLIPHGRFTPDDGVLHRTLARLPAVREPWLREMHDRYFLPRWPPGR